MTRIEDDVEIRAPVEKVYNYTTDATSWNKWQTTLPEAEQTSKGPVGVGTTFRGMTRLMGRSMPWTAVATEFNPNTRFGKNISSGPLFIEQHNTYLPTEGGMRFTIRYDMSVNGFLKLLSPMLIRSMRKELRKSLDTLKGILEA
jgi:ligand-binding SRPBCC domain-containing protein